MSATRLTDAVGESIRAARASGMALRGCAARTGIPWPTVCDWLRKGRAGVEPYAGWVRRWDEAGGELEQRLRDSIIAGAGEDPEIALKYLAFLDGQRRRTAEADKARHEARLAKLKADGAAPITDGPELALPASLTTARLEPEDNE